MVVIVVFFFTLHKTSSSPSSLSTRREHEQSQQVGSGKMHPIVPECSTPLPIHVEVRRVYAQNLLAEFTILRQAIRSHPIVSLDTEFPGIIFNHINHYSTLSSADRYCVLKANVDNLHLIQVGLTLTDADGNLPCFPDGVRYVWEFNFRDFNPSCDPHAPKSIDILRSHGLDLERNRASGIDSVHFAKLMAISGLICNDSAITWVTFQGAYDFAYLLKILTRRTLPETLEGFLHLLRHYFGNRVFDIKHMLKYCDGVHGGLDRVARVLLVDRAVGRCHQAGSDSLLTCRVYHRMKEWFFMNDDETEHAGVFFGLDSKFFFSPMKR